MVSWQPHCCVAVPKLNFYKGIHPEFDSLPMGVKTIYQGVLEFLKKLYLKIVSER